ncbi:WD40/YVTN/BNR-like repeat-containing protein [candidate division KSB1 bacterium]
MRRVFLIVLLFFCVTAVMNTDLYAQRSIDEDLLNKMQWRNIGPDRGGRSVAVTGVVGDPMTYYFGGTGSGVWKTTNGGNSWYPVLDDVGTSSVGAVAVSASDPNVVYVGMGEQCPRGNISHGDGVYKSNDAGETWTNVGLRDNRYTGDVIVHPTDPDIAYVGALGHLYAPPGEYRGDHGVYRTMDGGKTWQQVLKPDNNKAGAIDLCFDPKNPRVIYAAIWEIFRSAYSMSSGGPASGLYKSTDAGETWTRIEGGGFPSGMLGRIGVSVSPANPDVVYAIIENENGGVFISRDAGKTWRRRNEERNLRQRAWYYTHIFADPKNENVCYVENTGMYKSVDYGATFESIGRGIHGDHHDLWLNPDNPLNMIGGNDGGANVSFDGGYTWTHSQHPTVQFYGIDTDNELPYNVYGAQQDNSTIKMNSRSSGLDFYSVGGGESGHVVPDPRDHNIVYAGSYGGLLTRYDHYTGFSQNIQAWPDNPMGWGAGELKYRFQWTAPILISPHDPTKLYHAANVLFRSTDEGMSWDVVSPDLTKNDKSRQGKSGGPLTHDDTSVEYYCTIFGLEESLVQPGLLWAGSDDGLVHITRDDCSTWDEVTPDDIPEWGLISSVEPSHFDAGKCYIAVDNHEYDDHRPYVYKTENYGRSWDLIIGNLPAYDFVRCVREDPVVEGLLYLGTESAMFYSIDDGESWHPLQLNLPRTPVHDIEVTQNELAIATHGRGFWILDDLEVIHQLRNTRMSGDKLLQPDDIYKGPGYGSVPIYFFIDGDPKEASLTFEDAAGNEVIIYTTSARRNRLRIEEGMNMFSWNRRYEGMVTVPGHPMWAASTAGPEVVPGVYTVILKHDGGSQSQQFEIKMHPKLPELYGTTQAGLEAQRDLLLKIRDKATEVHETVNSIRSIKSDLAGLKDRASKIEGTGTVIEGADDLIKKLSDVEAKILQVKSQSSQDPLNYPIKVNNKIAALNGVVARSYKRPTAQSYEVYDMLVAEFDGYKREYDAIMEEIPGLNQTASAANIPAVIIKK